MSEPASLPYRLLTGKDDQGFCQRVNDALANGYVLYGSPSITRSDRQNYVCQAVVRP